ncbi:MAG: DUF935 domain-containing protein [Aromatoleum sp.]|jgi:phage gp29-like protein|uniref:DUF935 domain-containing protein n=1 Tax=Aromatoleum sp. TaxID=2307007 RepID=UPI002895A95D|nr:DUF935 domain-containing protein [Aromatoleum sp.]MDT3668997.1 DUF935 domain-containing protein [Aromatoleum sp.]
MKILDQHGNPIDTGVLREPQTARVAALQHELVQSQLDGLTPAKAARILKEADAGDIVAQHQLFDDMADRDAHLRCEFDKRRGAVLGLDWSIEPPANASRAEKKLAAWVEEILRDVVDDLEDVILAMMDAVGHGFAPIEIEWERWGTEWLPKFHPRPQTWFQLDTMRRNLRLKDGSGDGAEPIPMGWILHQHVKAKTGYLGRMGLSRVLVWPFLYKAYSVGDFAEFLETYGLPIIVGKYPQTATPEEKSSLMRAVTALGHDARAIMPEQMAIEIQKITGSASGTPHLEMVDWADRAQSKAILGQVLSSEAKATGLGSGVADLHAEVRRDILIADARQIAGTLTRDLVYPLIALNQGGLDSYRRCPRWVFDLGEAEDLKLYAEALPALAQGGARIPVSWVHEKLRIPRAAEGEAVFRAAPAAMPNAADSALAALTARYSTAALSTRLTTGSDRDPADRLLPALGAQAEAHVAAWRDDIEAMLAAAGSLEEFREQLFARYAHLPADELVAVMATALSAIHLAGRSEVQDGR